MKISAAWLHEWVNPNVAAPVLANTLTMGGFEVEGILAAAGEFNNVVIGEITQIKKHPEATRLNLCEVNIGDQQLNIVCGAANARLGLKAPLAKIKAILPNGLEIKPAVIRGMPSEGMLCSAQELGLAEESAGLLELPADAPIGKNLRDYLQLDDEIFEISITPNRGDCLSVRGMARETAALTQSKLTPVKISEIPAQVADVFPVFVEAKSACPHYVGRVIRNIHPQALTPIWLKERLRRSGLRSIHPVVDVVNYVMLELGQPMHAFDLKKLKEKIVVRMAKKGEHLQLLDDSEKELNAETLIIADAEKPLAIAGVMGGIESSVTTETQDIFLESAYFVPQQIAMQRQFYHLNSDSAYRYERGVDASIQQEAIERATQLILQIAGGEAGPVSKFVNDKYLPKANIITLSPEKITKVLGISISNHEVENMLNLLHFSWQWKNQTWLVEAPPYRFDINLPEDIIEEIARLYGYDKIPAHMMQGKLTTPDFVDGQFHFARLRQTLSNLGYQEIVSYSFIDKKLQRLFDSQQLPYELLNPITAEMTVMRTNLWPGLLNALQYNLSRQQKRVRLFEIGTAFIPQNETLVEEPHLAGLITGFSAPEQWGIPTRLADFYDVKAHVETILNLYYPLQEIEVRPEVHAALHPGQTAAVYFQGQRLGVTGLLHPQLMQTLDLREKVYVFDLNLALLQKLKTPLVEELSKFPEIRRDLAILIKQAIPVKDIQATIKSVVGNWLKEIFIFDVYQGKGIPPGFQSIALGLILQDKTRTLTDEEVADVMQKLIHVLKEKLGAELRS